MMNFNGKVSDLNAKGENPKYDPDIQYATSKLAQIHYSNHIAKNFKKEGQNVESVSVHPGKKNS